MKYMIPGLLFIYVFIVTGSLTAQEKKMKYNELTSEEKRVIIHKGTEFTASGRVAQLIDSLCFDLANPLPGNSKTFTHLFQGMITFHLNTVAHAQHLFLAWCQ